MTVGKIEQLITASDNPITKRDTIDEVLKIVAELELKYKYDPCAKGYFVEGLKKRLKELRL